MFWNDIYLLHFLRNQHCTELLGSWVLFQGVLGWCILLLYLFLHISPYSLCLVGEKPVPIDHTDCNICADEASEDCRAEFVKELEVGKCLVDGEALESLQQATQETYNKYNMKDRRPRPAPAHPPLCRSVEQKIEQALSPLCPRMPGSLGPRCSSGSHGPEQAPRQSAPTNSSLMWCQAGNECEYHKSAASAYDESQCNSSASVPRPSACHRNNESNLDNSLRSFTIEQQNAPGKIRPWCPTAPPMDEIDDGPSCSFNNQRNNQNITATAACKPKAKVCFADERKDKTCLAEAVSARTQREQELNYHYGLGGPNCRRRTKEKPTTFQFFKGPGQDGY